MLEFYDLENFMEFSNGYLNDWESRFFTDIKLKLVEVSQSKRINFTCQVYTTNTKAPNGTILGNNYLSMIGIVLNYEQKIIQWNGTDIPIMALGELIGDEV